MDQTHDSYKFFNKTIPSFPYQDYGVKGVGKYRIPILTMDQYRDQSKDLELHIECCKGLALSNNYKMGMTYGSIPPEESNRLFGALSWTDVLKEIKSKNVDNLHLRALEEIADLNKGNELQSLYKYAYFALGAAIPWFFALYLKKAGFSEKTSHNENYTEDAAHFPKLLEYINT
ncbi:MAG: hypothetical protein N2235_23335, partial [Fischerella sp.]|nr:hypothetical protein [Fischerella sp.]